MKKLTLALATLLCATFTFTSCSEEEVAAAFELTGAWQCEAISGTAGGFDLSSVLSTSNTDYGQYTKLFSIYMVGTTTGYYYRVGDAEQFGNVASSLISAASNTSDDAATWKKFLSKGTYTAANGILTFTSSDNGEVEEFQYSVADGYLTLTSKGVDVTGGNEAAANVTGVINSILAIAGRSETINTNVGIVYRYKKVGFEDLKNLFSKN